MISVSGSFQDQWEHGVFGQKGIRDSRSPIATRVRRVESGMGEGYVLHPVRKSGVQVTPLAVLVLPTLGGRRVVRPRDTPTTPETGVGPNPAEPVPPRTHARTGGP